ncbi:MAG TPA: hypothetical protein VGM80_16360 [Gaiellaceae bacterium]|jgi:hypothetical protein
MQIRSGAPGRGVAALTLAALGSALVLAASAQAQTVTIQVTSLSTVAIPHDIKPTHTVNKGDWIEFKDLLLNRVAQFGKKKGRAVAYDVGTITYTSSSGRKLICKAIFPGVGTISYGGVVIDHKDGTTSFPITGGTGGFKNAKGTVTFHAGATTQPNTFVVTVPGDNLDIHGGGGVA